MTFVFYDTETTDSDAIYDQILQLRRSGLMTPSMILVR
jgi:hypothetical protein